MGVALGQGGGKVPLTSPLKSCNRLRLAFPEPSARSAKVGSCLGKGAWEGQAHRASPFVQRCVRAGAAGLHDSC